MRKTLISLALFSLALGGCASVSPEEQARINARWAAFDRAECKKSLGCTWVDSRRKADRVATDIMLLNNRQMPGRYND